MSERSKKLLTLALNKKLKEKFKTCSVRKALKSSNDTDPTFLPYSLNNLECRGNLDDALLKGRRKLSNNTTGLDLLLNMQKTEQTQIQDISKYVTRGRHRKYFVLLI